MEENFLYYIEHSIRIHWEELFQLLERHLCGDWGDVSDSDARANELALRHDLRIMSWYQTSCGARIQIITEADRSVTTILLAKEY